MGVRVPPSAHKEHRTLIFKPPRGFPDGSLGSEGFSFIHTNYTVLDITLDKKGNTEASIKILLKEEDYQPRIEQKVKEYRKQVNLKGFRPGKVPAGLIKKMYGKAIKVEEINELLAKRLPEYIQENDLKIVGEPLPNRDAVEGIDWDNQSDFEFSYDVGYVNDFTYDISDQVKVTKYTIPVTDEKIDEAIENLKKRFGTTEDVEGASERHDLLTGMLSQVKSPEENTAEDQETEDQEAEAVLENGTTVDLPSLSDEQAKPFVGAQVGDEIFFELRDVFPEDKDIATQLEIEESEAKDLEGEFSFRVESVSREQPAEMNQEFFDKVFGPEEAKDETSFREKVREAIVDNYQQESEALLARDIRNYYVEHTNIEIPHDFLKRWILATNKEEITEEQLDSEFDEYIKEMKWSLISNKIAEDREIKVEHDEVKQKAREAVFAQFGGMMNSELMNDERFDPIVDNYLQAENGNNYMRIFNQARAEKVLDQIKQAVTIEEKEVTTDEFNDQFKAA